MKKKDIGFQKKKESFKKRNKFFTIAHKILQKTVMIFIAVFIFFTTLREITFENFMGVFLVILSISIRPKSLFTIVFKWSTNFKGNKNRNKSKIVCALNFSLRLPRCRNLVPRCWRIFFLIKVYFSKGQILCKNWSINFVFRKSNPAN